MKPWKDKEAMENIDDPRMDIDFQSIKKSERKMLIYLTI